MDDCIYQYVVKVYFFPTCIFIKNILVFVNDFKCVWFFLNLHFSSIIFTKPMYHVYMYDILDFMFQLSCWKVGRIMEYFLSYQYTTDQN